VAVQGLAARMMETLTYTYDVMNRRTGETRSSAPARTFGYDPTGQLTAVNQSGGNATFAYDAVGNRNTVTGAPGAGTYTANNLNQYTTAGGVGALTYDANGNLATGGGWTYTHNGNNRLVGVSGPATASIGRDGRNRDVKRTINGVTTYLIYDGWNLIAEYNGAGVLTTQYIHGPQVDEILAKATPTSTTFPLPDALGSTIAVTDQSGALMERVYYTDAFGTPTFKNGSGATLAGTTTGTRFLFTGREWLSQFGLYDYRNRTYSAAFGRFVEKDPIGFRAGDLNLYRYVSNNPVNLTDPLGLWTVQVGVSVSGLFGVAAGSVFGGLAFDSNGGFGSYWGFGAGAGGGADAFGGVSFGASNGDCIEDLGGPFLNGSADLGAGAGASLDAFSGLGSKDQPIVGGGVSLGVGAGAGFSVGPTITNVNRIW